ncbi:MAG: hypothetical protein IJ546_02090, partial [Prevotella sp.]|nr:hypothetical protein [Prevotella sp.]
SLLPKSRVYAVFIAEELDCSLVRLYTFTDFACRKYTFFADAWDQFITDHDLSSLRYDYTQWEKCIGE